MGYKVVATPYDMKYTDGVYTMKTQIAILDWLGSGDNNYVLVYATATTFNPLLPNWKSRINTAIQDYAEDEEIEIDTVMWLPDFSLLGL